MKTYNISIAKAKLSQILSEVQRTGETIVICKNGKPIADIVLHEQRHGRIEPHPLMKNIDINYDPTEPLNEDEWGEIG